MVPKIPAFKADAGRLRPRIRTVADPDPDDGPREEAEDLILTYGTETAREMAMSGHDQAIATGKIEKANYYKFVARLIDAMARRSTP